MPDGDSSTLQATDDDTGAVMHFTDYVNDGDEVGLWDDPDEERGWRGPKILYRDERGWRLRELTHAEHRARHDRILRRVLGA